MAVKRGHWLTVRAIDPALGGRDAIGAEIVVEVAGRRWHRLVQPSQSFLASNDPRVHFGLGTIAVVDAIRVLWPDGVEERFDGGATDRHIVLRNGEGRERSSLSELPSPAALPARTASAAGKRSGRGSPPAPRQPAVADDGVRSTCWRSANLTGPRD